jgi:hypothetical protein
VWDVGYLTLQPVLLGPLPAWWKGLAPSLFMF